VISAEAAEEPPHVADQQVGHLVGREVAAMVEHRPADAAEVAPNAARPMGVVVGSVGGVVWAFS
jgi:hypothetical protein